MTDVWLSLWHMMADINHLTIKVSVDLLVSSYSRCHPTQNDRNILHRSLILANCFTALQLWNLDSLASLWQLGNSSCGFPKPPRVNLSLIPTSPDFQWFPTRTCEGLHNLDPIYHSGLDTSHASFSILSPIFLNPPHLIVYTSQTTCCSLNTMSSFLPMSLCVMFHNLGIISSVFSTQYKPTSPWRLSLSVLMSVLHLPPTSPTTSFF